jgi:hypothetical protein
MITIFKIFENFNNRKYWLLPTDGDDGTQDSIRWGWSDFVNDDGKLTDIWYENNDFKFMGLVNIDENEVRSKLETNKYNL